MESIEKPRWNFSSVDWELFAANIDHVVRFIPACSDLYARFSNAIRAAAKRHVSRGFHKAYILGWNQDCKICTGRVKQPKKTKVGKKCSKHEFHPI
jgi:hypothetical protein